MAVTNKRFVEGTQLTTSAVSQYPAPVNTTSIIKKLTICNSTAGAVTVTIYLVPNGGTAGVTNILISARSIAAGATQEIFEAENHVLLPGDFLSALASAGASLTLAASGIEIV